MMLLGIGLALAAAAAWILVPLWRTTTEAPARPSERDELEARHREILLSLQDVDFDLQTGKLSPEDHQRTRGRLQTDAVGVLQRLEQLSPAKPPTGPAFSE